MGMESLRREIIEIDPKEIKVSPYSVRKKDVKGYDWEAFKGAIKATNGPVHPPIITKNKEVIVGQRRVLASQELGLPKIRVAVLGEDISEEEAVKLSFLENRGRRNINSDEEEDAIKRLLAIFKHSDKVAEFLGSEPSLVSLILSRAGIPEAIKPVTSKYRLIKGVEFREGDKILMSTTIRMPDSLHRWFRSFCKKEGKTFSDGITYAVEKLKEES